jgi:cobalt-zinc-cadmium efflux system protein
MLMLGPIHSNYFSKKNFLILIFCSILLAISVFSQAILSFYFNSLMLLASATHMLADCVFLISSAVVLKLASKPQDTRKTYGFARLEVLASFANGVILLIIASQILFSLFERNLEGVLDFFHNIMHQDHSSHNHLDEDSHNTHSGHSHSITLNSSNAINVLYLSGFLLIVNIVVSFSIYFARKENIKKTKNILLLESTLFHMLNDMIATLITFCGALIILYTDYKYTDALFSIILCVLILRLSFQIIKKSSFILLDFTPKSININEFKDYLQKNIKGCQNVFHIHIWQLNESDYLANFSVLIDQSQDIDVLIIDIKKHIKDRYNIKHSFIEVKLEADNSCSVIN